MEIKKDQQLTFLYVLIEKKQGDNFSIPVYRKKTGANRYIHVKLYLSITKYGIFYLMIIRSMRVTDKCHMEKKTILMTRFIM